MNFKDIYSKPKLHISIEIFPPKDEAGVTSLFEALEDLSALQPAFISVTYGAMGSTRDLTHDLALRIKNECKLPVASHFTCVGSGKTQIQDYIEKLKSAGIDLVVALRGDAPKGSAFVAPADGFQYANELVTYLKSLNGFSLAVAGYPEKHIEAASAEIDLDNLKRKVDAGADIILTQMFFDNEYYFDFVERARARGITIPIVPGIMPIMNVKQVEKIAGMCGARIPATLHEQLLAKATDTLAQREIGVEQAIKQCQELKKAGVPGIHFYSMNKSYSVMKVIAAL
ncbi:MAG: Methylenetetrahydrofolate reductase [uncultured bacterium]|nr:MAG: Methylenetetrahydrofolate reductase [uncultured bacterium]